VVDGAQRPRLLLETLAPSGIGGEFGGKNLDRHRAIQPGVAGAPHLAHAALTELIDDLVIAELPADHAGCRAVSLW